MGDRKQWVSNESFVVIGAETFALAGRLLWHPTTRLASVMKIRVVIIVSVVVTCRTARDETRI